MKKEQAEEFTQALGHVVGGSYRLIQQAKELGVPKALGLSLEDWVNKYLSGYTRMTIDDRRKAVEELKAEGETNREIGRLLGVTEGTVRNDLSAQNYAEGSDGATENQSLADDDAQNYAPLDTVTNLGADKKIRSAAKATKTRRQNEGKRKSDLERPVNIELPPDIYHGDFRILSDQIPDNSVELVFTDPPYDEDSVPLYAEAAKVAARILKPNGSLIAYTGQRHLPDVLASMSEHLRYWWTCAGIHEGGNQILQKLGIRCGWKPLVWFVKDTRGDVQNVMLDVVRGDREKGTHEWQQALSEARYFIERLCPRDGCVVDFFLGSGTARIAAAELGRRFIGFELNANTLERAERRFQERAA